MAVAPRSEQECGGFETMHVTHTNYRGSAHLKTEPGHHFVSVMSKSNEPLCQMWCKAGSSSEHRHEKNYTKANKREPEAVSTKQLQQGNGSLCSDGTHPLNKMHQTHAL